MCIRIKYCCCLKVKKAAHIVGILSIIYGLVKTLFCCYILAKHEQTASQNSAKNFYITKIVLEVQLVVYFCFFLISVLMYIGVKITSHRLMFPWLIVTTLFIITDLAEAIFLMIQKRYILGSTNLMDAILAICCFICVYSHYKNLQELSRPKQML
ncbi:uncharacterized protein LOC111627995 [Centruroides sculpturatus]|uniref:uncharacterized protein LOC111627995 n=1 Tax=Centruroides sculpturatus TaxID=218467 RepID=UPI000C6EC487|nr:uncharacterized protein LOC111627995 [Centruroides sculpturatus]